MAGPSSEIADGERAVVRGGCREEIEMRGCFCEMSVTHSNSAANPVLVSQNSKGLSVKLPAWARARAFPRGPRPSEPDLAQYCFFFSLFFFYPTLEICRKLQKNGKNAKPIFLDS